MCDCTSASVSINRSYLDSLSGNCLAAQDAVATPAFQIAARHHHVPNSYGIKIANKEKRPEKRHEERDCQNRVLNEEAPLTLR